MEQSRRAVESYWRSRMIDSATSDEEKVTPVYKLEEICDLLRSSQGSIVKEVSEFILKRLDHKSPVVKQKTLRVIKYAVGKSGAEFMREMQRNSVVVRQLIHYKGNPDPLKGDALNKAVRETAQGTLSVLFSSDDSKAVPTENSFHSRIEGFGNTNYETPSEDRRSFLSEVVDIGSATIKQGLSSLALSPSLKNSSDIERHRSLNLRGSLTTDNDYSDRYEGISGNTENYNFSRFSSNAGPGGWGQHPNTSELEAGNKNSGSTYHQKNREEKLLETIVTASGIRLQPTRDALHVFLMEASKLNALPLGHAIEAKLRSPSWQVRMKAMSVLEAILRKKDDSHFSVIASYFGDNKDVVVQCSESPQASLREKATKVLSLLGGEQIGGVRQEVKSIKTSQPLIMPDLIDTGDNTVEDLIKTEADPNDGNAMTSSAPVISDLLGDHFGSIGDSIDTQKREDDPFSDVSFHINQTKDHADDPFLGLPIDKPSTKEAHLVGYKTKSEDPAIVSHFSSSSEVVKEHRNSAENPTNLMDDLSINGNDHFSKRNGRNFEIDFNIAGSVSHVKQDNTKSNDVLINGIASEWMNAKPMFPMGAMVYNLPSGLMFNPTASTSQPMNYNEMGTLLAQQQQFFTTPSNFQLGKLQSNYIMHSSGSRGGNSSPLPDIFNPVIATESPTYLLNGSKKEDSKAFDFISDHVASARDRKHLI